MALLELPKFPKTTFYYMRHGETDWNLKDVYMGSTDIPLNERGRKQAHNVLPILKNLSITTVCHSPLLRAHETSLIVNDVLKSNLHCIQDLRECCWGIMEGKSKISTEWRDQWKEGAPIEGAETYQNFVERTNAAIRSALDFAGPVLIIAHGGVYWSILETLRPERPFPKRLENCDILEISPTMQTPGAWTIRRLTTSETEGDSW